jgi:hypothetical protein
VKDPVVVQNSKDPYYCWNLGVKMLILYSKQRRHYNYWIGLQQLVVLLVLLLFLASSESTDDKKQNSYRPPYTADERAAEYIRRGHTWPIVDFLPNTTGWSNLMKRRISQVQAIQDPTQKYDGWIETLAMALTTPNFTEFGWGLTQGPPELTEELRTAIYEGLPNVRSEGRMLEIDGPNPPDFLDRPDLTQKVSSMRGISPTLLELHVLS